MSVLEEGLNKFVCSTATPVGDVGFTKGDEEAVFISSESGYYLWLREDGVWNQYQSAVITTALSFEWMAAADRMYFQASSADQPVFASKRQDTSGYLADGTNRDGLVERFVHGDTALDVVETLAVVSGTDDINVGPCGKFVQVLEQGADGVYTLSTDYVSTCTEAGIVVSPPAGADGKALRIRVFDGDLSYAIPSGGAPTGWAAPANLVLRALLDGSDGPELTLWGSPTFVAGTENDPAHMIADVGGYARYDDVSGLKSAVTASGEMTLTFWARQAANPVGYANIVGTGTYNLRAQTMSNSFTMGAYKAHGPSLGNTYNGMTLDNQGNIVFDVALPVAVWHHYALVYHQLDSKYQLWIDGVLVVDKKLYGALLWDSWLTAGSAFNFLSIGSYSNGAQQGGATPFQISDFQAYSRKLSQVEIFQASGMTEEQAQAAAGA
jgi:hypothetical protein